MSGAAFDCERFERYRQSRGLGLGAPLRFVQRTGSTSDDAMAAARAGAPHGATFVADVQTRGRGRRGSIWSSPPGENLLFSVVLRPRLTAERAGTLTLPVGLAVRDAVAPRIEARVLVKWPNDLVVDDKKLAGILLESQLTGAEVSALVVGVGVNVAMRELPDEIARIATSLALLESHALDRTELLLDILGHLEARLEAHVAHGLDAALPELRAADALRGRRLRVEALEGVAAGIEADGALRLQTDDGRIHSLRSGSVLLL